MNRESTELEWHRTSPVAVVFFLFRTVRQVALNALPAVVVVAAAYASGGAGRKALMTAGAIALAAIGLVGSVLSWLRFRFCINGDRVLVRSGVLHREELEVEFGRIQNVNLREPFYMRPFGLVVLGIDTAGSNQKEILLGGIGKDLAVQIRERILAGNRPVQEQETPEVAGGQHPTALLSRNTSDIAIYGLTVNFILWFAIAVGAVMSAGDSSEKVLAWAVDKFNLAETVMVLQDSLDIVDRFLLGAGIVLAVILLLPLVSVAGALFRHHGYQLNVDGETYKRAGGLLTRHEESLKRHKIQAVVLKQNLVARLFKRTNMQLRVARAGAGAEAGQVPIAGGATFMIPALHPAEVSELVPEFLAGCDIGSVQFSRINRQRLMKIVMILAGLMALPATTALSTLVSWKFVAILPVVVLVAALASYRYWIRFGYAVVGEYGFVRHGFIGTTVTAFPLFKIQRVDISQSRGQRKRGLATLVIHLASHSMTVRHVDFRDARTFGDLALYHAESTGRAWY